MLYRRYQLLLRSHNINMKSVLLVALVLSVTSVSLSKFFLVETEPHVRKDVIKDNTEFGDDYANTEEDTKMNTGKDIKKKAGKDTEEEYIEEYDDHDDDDDYDSDYDEDQDAAANGANLKKIIGEAGHVNMNTTNNTNNTNNTGEKKKTGGEAKKEKTKKKRIK